MRYRYHLIEISIQKPCTDQLQWFEDHGIEPVTIENRVDLALPIFEHNSAYF